MKKHLVIVGFDDIVADKYMETIEQAISNKHISGYSIIDLISNQDWIEHKLQKVNIQPELQKLYTFRFLITKRSKSCESVPHFLTPKNSFAKTSSALFQIFSSGLLSKKFEFCPEHTEK